MSVHDLPEPACFALLDDCNATEANPASRLYTSHAGSLVCRDASQIGALLDDLQAALAQGNGLHAVGLFSYELGERLHGIGPDSGTDACADLHHFPPLAQILLFRECRRLSTDQATAWLDELAKLDGRNGNLAADAAGVAGVAGLRADVDEPEFHRAIGAIRDYIAAGDTYQVNYTYRLHFDAYGPIHALFRRLRERQPVPYGALIALPDGRAVLSCSPELFVRHIAGERGEGLGGILTACPMKGTAPATGDAQQDSLRAAALSSDPKGRAENLMIVDLLRNDLGRIARLGSVRVPELFDVKRHGGVLQMTSTIQAEIGPERSLAEVFAALYPCGSVTGAPKRRTLQIIRELEPAPRGLYTGAIGWFDPPKAVSDTVSGTMSETDSGSDPQARPGVRLGDFCLSVPIRTLVLEPPAKVHVMHGAHCTVRRGEMGVGAGIVHDSDPASEYAECLLKARFLTGLPNQFELFETMHATRAGGCRHLDLHLARLSRSTAYFGFPWEESGVRDRVWQACAELPEAGEFRMRLSLDPAGHYDVRVAPLKPWTLPARILLAPEPVRSNDLFLRHKTTVRGQYDEAWQAAEAQGAFDMLFFNERGEIAEGARSNLFLKLDGRWFTPPMAAGLLPGVMRTVLLNDPVWGAEERTLYREDLRRAQEIVVCNALRGVLSATVEWPAGDGG